MPRKKRICIRKKWIKRPYCKDFKTRGRITGKCRKMSKKKIRQKVCAKYK